MRPAIKHTFEGESLTLREIVRLLPDGFTTSQVRNHLEKGRRTRRQILEYSAPSRYARGAQAATAKARAGRQGFFHRAQGSSRAD